MALESTAVKRTANPNRENVENGAIRDYGKEVGRHRAQDSELEP